MELVNCFPRIQSLRDLGIISPRQLPVESFLHDAWFFGCLGDFWLTLHAVVPLPFFLSLPLSPPTHNPLYQNVSVMHEGVDSMPIISVNGAALYYEEHGTGPEIIVFAHGLLWSCRMYDAQVALLKERYRCVAFDFRGQGQSEVTRSGYDMETLYEDAVALINQLGCAPCHFLGLSMGGFIGLRLAARHPELMPSLILLETSADP